VHTYWWCSLRSTQRDYNSECKSDFWHLGVARFHCLPGNVLRGVRKMERTYVRAESWDEEQQKENGWWWWKQEGWSRVGGCLKRKTRRLENANMQLSFCCSWSAIYTRMFHHQELAASHNLLHKIHPHQCVYTFSVSTHPEYWCEYWPHVYAYTLTFILHVNICLLMCLLLPENFYSWCIMNVGNLLSHSLALWPL